MKSTTFAKLAVAGACWIAAAGAQEGDPQAGEYAFATCSGCHAVPGYANAYPTYHVPRLGGQNPAYIVAALQAYKNKQRDHQTMYANAAALSDTDMTNIGAYLAQFGDLPSDIGPIKHGDPAAGEKLATTCVACHGEKGNKPTQPIYPRLAGQYEDYLLKALQEYKVDPPLRTSPNAALMYGMVANLSEQDLADLAAYYAIQEPTLTVVEYDGGE